MALVSMLSSSKALTKQIDAAWSSGDNAGGLFDGTVSNTTTYHVFLIEKDSDNSIDAGFDTSVTAANIPTGYTNYRRIGSVMTNESANIIPTTQYGNSVVLDVAAEDVDATETSTAVTAALSVPIGVAVIADISLMVKGTGPQTNGYILVTPLDITDTAPTDTNNSINIATGTAAFLSSTVHMKVKTNTSGQIRYRGGGVDAGFVVRITTKGWTDNRGKQ
jgi:hypothetical protein